MATRPRFLRLLGTWTALVVVVGAVGATVRAGGADRREAVQVAGAATGEAARRPTTTPATTATPDPTTTAAPVETTRPPTTAPPTTEPPATLPPTTEPPETGPPAPEAPAATEPAAPSFAVTFGPEVYEPNGTPIVHLDGTGCTGPGHTNGQPYTAPFEYGVSYFFTTLDGRDIIRMDPEHSQPGTGSWTQTFPAIEGPGEFLVTATCLDADSELTPNGWASPHFEYPPQPFTVPG